MSAPALGPTWASLLEGFGEGIAKNLRLGEGIALALQTRQVPPPALRVVPPPPPRVRRKANAKPKVPAIHLFSVKSGVPCGRPGKKGTLTSWRRNVTCERCRFILQAK